jgi:ubiquitin C-terminal hydrolase
MEDKVSGTGGIVNIGFTCYANSVFQAFRHCNKIKDILTEDAVLKADCKYNNMTKQLSNLVQTLFKIDKGSSIRPNGFFHNFDTAVEDSCFEHLASRQPHDAHEFLIFILDAIHESFSRSVNMKITDCIIKTDKQQWQLKSLELWKSQFEKQFSPFVNLFFGIFHIQVICSKCNNITNNFETFNILKGSFNDKNSITVTESLLKDLNDEILEDYHCDNCKIKIKAIKRTRVWKLPPNLILVFKRFTYDGRKISSPIVMDNNTINLESIFSTESPTKNECKYSLRSIVDHHGSINGGHYTAQAKHSSNNWYLYDDQSVYGIEKPIIGENTYIIFLDRV